MTAQSASGAASGAAPDRGRTPGAIADIGSTARGVWRLALYLAVTLIGIPFQVLFVKLGWSLRASFPVAYHRLCCRILGLDIAVVGAPSDRRPTLFIVNHSSYLDIPVLSALLPVSFVAKAEVAAWPLFGLLADLQRTVYVNRTARLEAHRQRDNMVDRLQAGDNLVLFPEGTSSDGNRTLPFKTALFAVASTKVGERSLVVQPVSVTATHLDGIPLGHTLRSLYAWYGDMELPPHLWRMVKAGRLRVVVQFHPPLTVEEAGSRKALADRCWQEIASGVDRAVRGRV